MTVTELIEALKHAPGNLPVFRYANWPVEQVTLETDTPESEDGQQCVTLY
jgi:hypothetical protein